VKALLDAGASGAPNLLLSYSRTPTSSLTLTANATRSHLLESVDASDLQIHVVKSAKAGNQEAALDLAKRMASVEGVYGWRAMLDVAAHNGLDDLARYCLGQIMPTQQ